ncbi:hypothetical protein ACOSP7_026744 [Xanthoceras sorbifolium]
MSEKICDQLKCAQEQKQMCWTIDVPHQQIQSKNSAASKLKQVGYANPTCNHNLTNSLQQKQVDSGASTCSNRLTNSKSFDQITVPPYNTVDRPKKLELFSSNHGFNHDRMQYDIVVVLISSQRCTMSLEDAQFLLLMHEQRIESLNSTSQVSINGSSANYASNNNAERKDQRGGSSYNRNGSRIRGKGGRSEGMRPYCQLCTKPGHHTFQCYHRFDQHF